MKKLNFLIAGAMALCFGAGAAVAQLSAVIAVPYVKTGDLLHDVVGGYSSSTNSYASPGQISGISIYKAGGTITTDPSYTFLNGQFSWFGHAAGTITTVTLTTEPNPADGKRECYYLDQTTSTLTWTANTGQTINASVPTAGVAKNPNCITYQASTATWFASP